MNTKTSSARVFSWAKHLIKRRGLKFFKQTSRMFYFHMEPFQRLLGRIYDILLEYDANFTFPLVAAMAEHHESYIEYMKSYPFELAIHGYKHVRYQHLTANQIKNEINQAIDTFKKYNIPFKGFRAPYNNYTEDVKQFLNKHEFLWDIGIGYNPQYREQHQIFKIKLQNEELANYYCIPLNKWSDDLMIDRYHLSDSEMAKIMTIQLKKAKKENGVVMFDLHPIRIGRKEYVSALKLFLEQAYKLDAWVPSVTEAVEYWDKHKQWKHDAPVCCLLTGDIDNITFFDYLRRF